MKLPTGHRVIHFERIDSTNAEARRLAEAGECGPLWIWSDEQTAGRGRLGRNWVSEPGNLYVTCLFQTAAAAAAQISFVAAIAVYEVSRQLLPKARFFLKWPNDVLMGGAKFCGLLPEVVGANPMRIALGCGINLTHAPREAPYPVAALGAEFTADAVLQKIALSLWNWLEIWDEGRDFATIRAAWLERAAGVGKNVTVDGLTGRFEGLAEDGALLLTLADGTQKKIHAGDVRFAGMENLNSGKI